MSRITAWAALRSGSTAPLRMVDRLAYRNGLDARDTALARKLVGTEARRRGTLRAVLNHFIDRKAKPDLAAHLHLGLTQILFLDRIPPHAAVNETLGAVRTTLGPSKVHKVNAILRNVLRSVLEGTCDDPRRQVVGRDLHFDTQIFHSPVEHPLLWAEDALSMPAQLMKGWVKRFGEERAHELARLALLEPPLILRVLTGEIEAAEAELQAAGIDAMRLADPRSLQLPGGSTETALGLEGFTQGRWIVQGAWASHVADVVDAQPGERVLDLCAAPGGKTAVLATTGAQVIALDVSPFRLKRLTENTQRLGLNVPAIAMDGVQGLDPSVKFDAILVDAPCTNTGVLSARPEARWRFGPQSLRELNTLQERLLREASDRLAPGGRLIWSTCSIEPEENERFVARVVEQLPGRELSGSEIRLPGTENGPDGGGFTRVIATS